MASKVDSLIDKLEKLTTEVNEIRRGVIMSPIVPLPRPLKSKILAVDEIIQPRIQDAYFDAVRTAADIVLPADQAMEIINNPNVLLDSNGSLSQISSRPMMTNAVSAPAKPRKVTKKMRQQRKIQSKAFRNANAKARKKNGELRAGFDQRRIAQMAQRECTKERQRLGLCEKPMKRKSTRKGQVRKTARRAFEK